MVALLQTVELGRERSQGAILVAVGTAVDRAPHRPPQEHEAGETGGGRHDELVVEDRVVAVALDDARLSLVGTSDSGKAVARRSIPSSLTVDESFRPVVGAESLELDVWIDDLIGPHTSRSR